MDEQGNRIVGRMTHRLTLDSSQEERRAEQQRKEREEYENMKEEKRKRKEEKRRQREEQERAEKEKVKQAAELKKKQIEKYNDPAKLFEQDSSSGERFGRIHEKINEMFPKFAKKKRESSSDESDSEDSEDSEESSSSSHKKHARKEKKIEKKIERKRVRDESQASEKRRARNRSTVKVEHQLTVKDKLVQEVATRWWYALPEWPPVDFPFEEELKKRGYRLIRGAEFKFADEVVNGLSKVAEIDGYLGVFRTKHGYVDVRPKETAPTINYFYDKSEAQLNQLFKKAIKNQLEELKSLTVKQTGEQELIVELERKLISLK